jgi:hypothetical protein
LVESETVSKTGSTAFEEAWAPRSPAPELIVDRKSSGSSPE